MVQTGPHRCHTDKNALHYGLAGHGQFCRGNQSIKRTGQVQNYELSRISIKPLIFFRSAAADEP